MGLRMADLFTPTCTADETISIICASPPGTSVHHVFADQFLAEQSPKQERASLPTDFKKPGQMHFDVMPLDQLIKKLRGG